MSLGFSWPHSKVPKYRTQTKPGVLPGMQSQGVQQSCANKSDQVKPGRCAYEVDTSILGEASGSQLRIPQVELAMTVDWH